MNHCASAKDAQTHRTDVLFTHMHSFPFPVRTLGSHDRRLRGDAGVAYLAQAGNDGG